MFRDLGADIVDGADMFEDDEEPELPRRRRSHSYDNEEIISCREKPY